MTLCVCCVAHLGHLMNNTSVLILALVIRFYLRLKVVNILFGEVTERVSPVRCAIGLGGRISSVGLLVVGTGKPAQNSHILFLYK